MAVPQVRGEPAKPRWSLAKCQSIAQAVGSGARIETGTDEIIRVVVEFADGDELNLYPNANAEQQPTA